jgi:glycosyltransferase involved in cell wall biosynthesis
VAHYYKAVRPFLPEGVEYFVVGTRYGGRRRPAARRLAADYAAFARHVRGVDLVLVNPSLSRACFLREAVFVAMARAAGKPSVVFFRGWHDSFEREIERRWMWLFRRVYRRAAAVVVLSAAFERKVRAWGYEGPVHVETTAVDDALLAGFDPASRRDAHRPFRALFLSRIERDKGVFECVDAAARLGPGAVRLVMGGDGSAKADVERHAARTGAGAVEFPGYLSGRAKIEAFVQADAFLLPSYHEGMPNSVLEAMAFGLPVITCPTGGLNDFFADGEMGCLVPPRDAGAVAAALRRLIGDPARWSAMSAHNARYARDRFLASRVAGRLRSICEAVASRPRVAGDDGRDAGGAVC